MSKLSVVICTYNEEENIKRCLESVTWADEVVVVDDSSTDKTVEIAKKFTKNVFSHKGAGFVEPTRNFAIQKATNEWVLLVDADEQIPKTLATYIKEIITKLENEKVFVEIPRKNIIFNKWIQYTGWWPDYNIRLFKKGSVSWGNEIHSIPQTTGEKVEIEAKEDLAILHNHYSTVSQYLNRLVKYTKFQAEDLAKTGYTFKWVDLIRKPLSEFLTRFFAWEGYKDGVHGLALSLLQAFYILCVYVYLWEKQKFIDEAPRGFLIEVEEEGKKAISETKYWFLTSLVNNNKNLYKKILLKTRRRFLSVKK